jgi:proteasome assembly chaperone (PAC2) family protein
MLQVTRQMDLRQPVLLCAFSGWSDAASAATGALSYLLMKWAGHELASFDAEAIYSYTVTRPVVRYTDSGLRQLDWPSLTWTALPLPNAERDLVLLLGPEPDLRWQTCARASAEFARQLGVERIIGLGCFYAPVAHMAPVHLIGSASDGATRAILRGLGLGQTSYEGPTGFLSALMDSAQKHGMATAGIWGAAPSYLPGVANPKVSAALLGIVERVLRADLGRGELEVSGRDMERRIDEALRERPDLQEFVAKLQAGELTEEPPPLEETEEDLAPAEELPSAQALLEDLEQYLQGLQRPEDEPKS